MKWKSHSLIKTRAFSHRHRWHERFVPMPDRPNDASKLTGIPAVLAEVDAVQFEPNDDTRTRARKFPSH